MLAISLAAGFYSLFTHYSYLFVRERPMPIQFLLLFIVV